jgi:thiosulfate/3-mercaptopyruvate sulfurtransferase
MALASTFAQTAIPAAEAQEIANNGEMNLLDGTWALPDMDAPGPYLAGTTAILDTDAIKALPVAARTSQTLQPIFEAAGLWHKCQTAVYDRKGLFSAAWVWWMLMEMGESAWLVEGWSDETAEPPKPDALTFNPPNAPHVSSATLADVLAARDQGVQLIDARAPDRFHGQAPEPRPGLRSGHIPGAINLPYGQLKSDAPHSFKSEDALRSLFDAATIDLARPIITSCGSGVTASGLAYCLMRAGAEDVRVYMGSWAEYGATDHPIETGS